MFVLRLIKPNRQVSLFEGNYDACMGLAHALERFPSDVVSLEVYDSETMEEKYKWKSPEWN